MQRGHLLELGRLELHELPLGPDFGQRRVELHGHFLFWWAVPVWVELLFLRGWYVLIWRRSFILHSVQRRYLLGLWRLELHELPVGKDVEQQRVELHHHYLLGRSVCLRVKLLFLFARLVLIRRLVLVLPFVQRGHLLGLRRLELHELPLWPDVEQRRVELHHNYLLRRSVCLRVELLVLLARHVLDWRRSVILHLVQLEHVQRCGELCLLRVPGRIRVRSRRVNMCSSALCVIVSVAYIIDNVNAIVVADADTNTVADADAIADANADAAANANANAVAITIAIAVADTVAIADTFAYASRGSRGRPCELCCGATGRLSPLLCRHPRSGRSGARSLRGSALRQQDSHLHRQHCKQAFR